MSVQVWPVFVRNWIAVLPWGTNTLKALAPRYIKHRGNGPERCLTYIHSSVVIPVSRTKSCRWPTRFSKINFSRLSPDKCISSNTAFGSPESNDIYSFRHAALTARTASVTVSGEISVTSGSFLPKKPVSKTQQLRRHAQPEFLHLIQVNGGCPSCQRGCRSLA
jgi:hypothetical protein